jgi:tetratricopeptide (TPR) repeat protein
MGDVEGALTDWAKALELDPKELNAAQNRGIVLLGRDEIDKAKADFDHVIKHNPHSAMSLLKRSVCYEEMAAREPARAVAHLEAGIRDCRSALQVTPERHPLRIRIEDQQRRLEELLRKVEEY